ncbi:hypothetical protein [Nitrosospira sp. Nsp1]|uniref:hypothetical protein n=1 Tax=Nitrosospira sp. Nsp1 TaxID=136547 RepID=UPI00087FC137|nr:hypothetical protein [Nitrosospira sp. Nsp1]SCX63109.1 hypothetical protein SAMN05720354_1352 [Nitrosospira sp. Nsp1]
MIEFQQGRRNRCIFIYVNTKVARHNMNTLACVGTMREKRRNAAMMSAGLALPGAQA